MNTPTIQMPAFMIDEDISSFVEDMHEVDQRPVSDHVLRQYIAQRGVTLPDALPPFRSAGMH